MARPAKTTKSAATPVPVATNVTKSKKLAPLVTGTLLVKWGNLAKPDTTFDPNHSVTVVVNDELNKQLNSLMATTKAAKLNGMKEIDGVKTMKFKSKSYLEVGKFPCVDSQENPTEVSAFGGDKVRLKLQPAVLARDNSLSLYLNGVQIIEKNNTVEDSVSFGSVDGGFVSPSQTPENVQDNTDTGEDDSSEEDDDSELPF